MDSERGPDGGGRDSTDVLTRTARAPDLVLRYGDGVEHVADVHLPPMAVGSRGGTRARAPFTIFLHCGFLRGAEGGEPHRPLPEGLPAGRVLLLAPRDRRRG